MGPLVTSPADDTDGDYVWDSMLDYWAGTGQLDGIGVASSTDGLSEHQFRQLGYAASYGTTGFGNDIQDGTAEWFGSDLATSGGMAEDRWLL